MITKDDEVFIACFENTGCTDNKHKHVPFTLADIMEVIKYRRVCSCGLPNNERCDSFCDSESVGIVRLDNGKIGVFWEWSDTSGHG